MITGASTASAASMMARPCSMLLTLKAGTPYPRSAASSSNCLKVIFAIVSLQSFVLVFRSGRHHARCRLRARDRTFGGSRDRFGRDAEMRIELAGRCRGPKARHADKLAGLAEPSPPRAFDRRLDAHTRRTPEYSRAI